jgi:hypothetical protein
MSGKSKWDYLKAIYFRYRKASKALRSRILDEFCQVCRYNRKYAVRLLNGPAPQKPNTPTFKGRRPTYGTKVIGALTVSGKTQAIRAPHDSKLSCPCGCRGPSSA